MQNVMHLIKAIYIQTKVDHAFLESAFLLCWSSSDSLTHLPSRNVCLLLITASGTRRCARGFAKTVNLDTCRHQLAITATPLTMVAHSLFAGIYFLLNASATILLLFHAWHEAWRIAFEWTPRESANERWAALFSFSFLLPMPTAFTPPCVTTLKNCSFQR